VKVIAIAVAGPAVEHVAGHSQELLSKTKVLQEK
jgi:hypothetical protein